MCKLINYIHNNPYCDEYCIEAGGERHMVTCRAVNTEACRRQQQNETVIVHRDHCWLHYNMLLIQPLKPAFDGFLKTCEVALPEGGTGPAFDRLDFYVRVCVLDFFNILTIHFMRRHWRWLEERVHREQAGRPAAFAYEGAQREWEDEFKAILEEARRVYGQVRAEAHWEGQTEEFVRWFRDHPYYP